MAEAAGMSTPSLERRLQALKKNRATREGKMGGGRAADAPAPAPQPEPAPVPAPQVATPPRSDPVPAPRVDAAADELVEAERKHREEKRALSNMVQSLQEQLASATAGSSADAAEETGRLRTECKTLREENAGLRDEVRELTGKLEEQRRAAKRKVAELENLLRHVTEELSRAGDPARGASDGGQLAEDNARLEEELNRAEARQEQMAAEYEERLRIAEAAAPSSDELARLRKEKAAIEIVMNQLGEELEDEKHARQQAEQKAASAGTGVPVGASAAYDAAAAAMMADGSAGGEPRSQEALFRELDRAKAEHRTLQRESENRISELEQDLRAAQYDKQQAEDGAERQARDAEEMAKTKAHEYTGHLKELQQELVHVCNVLAVMEQNCKVLEKTQENTGILEGAKQEIDELTHRIETLEAELAQSHVDKDALTAQLRTESEKRQQFEEYIINSEKKKSELAAHLGSSMHNIRTFSVAPQQAAAPVGAPQPGQYVSMQGAPNGYGQPPPPATYAPQGNGAMGIEQR